MRITRYTIIKIHNSGKASHENIDKLYYKEKKQLIKNLIFISIKSNYIYFFFYSLKIILII